MIDSNSKIIEERIKLILKKPQNINFKDYAGWGPFGTPGGEYGMAIEHRKHNKEDYVVLFNKSAYVVPKEIYEQFWNKKTIKQTL